MVIVLVFNILVYLAGPCKIDSVINALQRRHQRCWKRIHLVKRHKRFSFRRDCFKYLQAGVFCNLFLFCFSNRLALHAGNNYKKLAKAFITSESCFANLFGLI